MERGEILGRGIRQETGCLVWPGSRNSKGYGTVSYKGRMWLVHRLAYSFEHGDIPAKQQICHRCDVRDCYEITHLFSGSAKDNIQDMHSKGRASMPLLRGEQHGRVKLTEAQVIEIRRRAKQGESQQSIADDFSVRQTTVSRIVRRKIWTHV